MRKWRTAYRLLSRQQKLLKSTDQYLFVKQVLFCRKNFRAISSPCMQFLLLFLFQRGSSFKFCLNKVYIILALDLQRCGALRNLQYKNWTFKYPKFTQMIIIYKPIWIRWPYQLEFKTNSSMLPWALWSNPWKKKCCIMLGKCDTHVQTTLR